MDKFPDWASRWLSKDTRQVSHGLNLALKLENPDKLPLLLWDIVVAQPKITRAMKELSFIHFARFVPSWDGTALMVTTEFDGPLEPYVMDFVIALGDVFDTLLSYVDPNVRPKLPTSEHPAEFWTFVQEWNRVPFARRIGGDDTVLFPPDFDYPLYSAYPEKTVTDILGKRTKLLPPAIDHPAAYVDLNDVQGNILNAYRAETAAHLFFSISDHLKARSWLATVFPQKGGNAWDGVMSAERWGVLKPTVMANVGLTYAGMKKLLPDRMDDLRKFPDAFREGAEKRGELNGDKGLSDPRYWLFGRDDQNIHVVLSLYTFEKKVPAGTPHTAAFRVFIDAFDALRKAALDNGMKLVCKQDAQALAGGKEQFGYTDGISKPRISGQCKPDDPDFQPAASPGEFLLGKDYKSIFGGSSLVDLPGDLAQNGTFGALRLLEQDVTAFKAMVKAEAARLAIPDEELLKAKLLGRWPQGEPLALDPEAPSGYVVNSFDYAPSWEHPGVDNDHEGAQCPIGAHIRRTNPRTARVAGQRHSRRLIRRGMPTDWVDADGTKKVGLLGLFIGASLERQFEFIQRQWIQGDLAASGIRGTQDPIAGLRSKPTRLRIRGNDDSDANTVIVPPLVTTRGSLYLFFPGISMLRGLEEAATPSSLRELNEEMGRDYRSGTALEFPNNSDRVELAGLRGLPGWILTFLDDLLFDKKLDSKWVKTLVAHFAPQPRLSCAPPDPVPPSGIDPLDPMFIANPYPAYAALRQAKTSVVWVKEHNAYWVLTRKDAQLLFDDPQKFRQKPSSTTLRGIITMDDPQHIVARTAVGDAFHAATAHVDIYIEEAINEALARLEKLEQFDFMTEYGTAVPRAVFWRIFGLPPDEVAACDALAQTMMRHYGQPERPGMSDGVVFADASVRLTGRLAWLLAKALLHPASFARTLIGEIAQRTYILFSISDRRLDFLESLMTLVQLALVHMSAQFLLGTAMRNFLLPDPRNLRGPTPWAELVTIFGNSKTDFDQALKGALEEARRVDAPVTIVERYAAYTLDIGGVTVQKDCPVFAVVASANRDGVADGDPEQFYWDRTPHAAHLSLGYGIHECIGKDLQEKLVPAALARLIEAMPDLRLCDRTAVPAWFDNIYFRALQSLPVTRCP